MTLDFQNTIICTTKFRFMSAPPMNFVYPEIPPQKRRALLQAPSDRSILHLSFLDLAGRFHLVYVENFCRSSLQCYQNTLENNAGQVNADTKRFIPVKQLLKPSLGTVSYISYPLSKGGFEDDIHFSQGGICARFLEGNRMRYIT